MFKLLLVIGTGGFIGSVLRYITSRLFQQFIISSFPIGTFAVNIIGCFILGIIYGVTEKNIIVSDNLRLFLTVGLCGGFTTFSTFTYENMSFLKEGDFLLFAIYTGLSVFLGILALYLGNILIKSF